MTVTSWIALAVVAVTVWALIKRYETRLILITAGLFLACISFTPMQALNAFAKSMTNSGLIMAICSAMGFALVIQMTKCDVHLVKLLSAPLSKLGFVLIPAATAITYFICVAIPSAAGCAAAVGPTLIPIMLRAGISKEGTAAAILAGTFGSMLSPGLSHNPFVAKMAGIGVMDVIGLHMPYTLVCGAISLVGVSIVCFALGDYKKGRTEEAQTAVSDDIGRCNILKAIAPLIPVALLVTGNLWLPAIKMGVAQAMLIGAIYTLAVTLANPQEFSKKFFVGMGKGYGDVLGIIIAAGVFAAGLTASGLVAVFIDLLKHSNEIARWGGSIGPFVMGVITGSGDAAAFAFNEAVTPHAESFGMQVPTLGAMAALSGALGRTMSPISGVAIVICGLTMVNPIELTKRLALPMCVCVIFVALAMV